MVLDDELIRGAGGDGLKRGRMLMGVVLVMTAVALAVALAVGLSGGGRSERAKSFLPHAVIKVVSGWCKQNRDAGYVDTWVLVRNVGQKPYPEMRTPFDVPMYKYHYNDGSDTMDSPGPDEQATVPVGQTVWLRFRHPYNESQSDVDRCAVTFDYETDYSLDVRT